MSKKENQNNQPSPDGELASGQNAMSSADDDRPLKAKRHKRFGRLGIAVGLGLALIAAAAFALPTFAARWILDSTLEDLGLEARGVDTVEIDLWNREIWFGPVAIGAPGAEPAQVERFGLTFSISELFDRRGLGEDAVIEGIVLEISRDAEGRISINGVDLFELLQAESAAAEAGPAETSDPWGVGLNAFTLRDSRARFTRADGGELVMEIDRFQLAGFRTWTPDTPGEFSLSAELNNVGLKVEGKATPFSDRIDVEVDTQLTAVNLDKVERFTGSLNLARGKGTMQAALDQTASIAPYGTLEIQTNGQIALDGISIALPDGPSIDFENSSVAVDISNTLKPDRSASLNGSIKIEGAQAELTLQDESRAQLAQATMQLSNIAVSADPSQVVTGGLSMTLSAKEGTARSRDRVVRFGSMSLEASLAETSVNPFGQLDGKLNAELTVTDPSLEGPIRGSANQLRATISDSNFSRGTATLSAAGATSIDLTGLSAESDATKSQLPLLLETSSVKLTAPRLELKLPSEGSPVWQLSYDELNVEGLIARAGGNWLGAVGFDTLRLSEGQLDSDFDASLGNLEISGIELSSDGSLAGNLRLKKAEASNIALSGPAQGSVARIRLSQLDTQSAIDGFGKTSLKINGIEAEGARLSTEGLINLERLSLSKLENEISTPPEATTRLGALHLENFSAKAGAEVEAGSAILSEVEILTGDGETLRLNIGRLALQNLAVLEKPALRIETVAMSGLDLNSTTPIVALIEGDGQEDPAGIDPHNRSEPETSDPLAAHDIRIGKFSLDDPARIKLTDSGQSPPVTLDTAIERLTLSNLDTRSPETQSAFDFAATVNEFTSIMANGWLQPVGDRPSFDFTADLKNLELHTFSPYAAEHIGMNLERGRLSAQAGGKMVEGELDVATKIDIRNLEFSPLTPEDAERLSATTGVPVETAVGLLEDSEGRIELSIPVKGNLKNPAFELDQVINKAIGNAIAGAIGTTLKVIFPPALLISVVESASDDTGIEFAPAPFQPGTVELMPKGQELVTSLGTLLKKRPKLSIRVCGRSTAEDVEALLAPEISEIRERRRKAHEEEMASYRERLAPLIAEGIVDENGNLLVEETETMVPPPPKPPVLDEKIISEELALARADDLRDRLTALAAERTLIVRRDLADRQKVENDQVAECRPVYDPQDKGPPRAVVNL